MENLRQYEFCHHLLETVLVGGVKAGGATPTPTAGKTEKKPSKWRLFHGKSSSDKSSKPSAAVAAGDRGRGGGEKEGKQVTFGKQAKQPKVKEKKSKKTTNKVCWSVCGAKPVASCMYEAVEMSTGTEVEISEM